jgi:hypothetical protein
VAASEQVCLERSQHSKFMHGTSTFEKIAQRQRTQFAFCKDIGGQENKTLVGS